MAQAPQSVDVNKKTRMQECLHPGRFISRHSLPRGGMAIYCLIMSDNDALLAAILAEPAEDMPRLLLAEWLDENAGTVECGNCGGEKEVPVTRHHGKEFMGLWTTTHREPCPTCSGTGRVSDGRAERAEFIRLQCELARMDGGEPDCNRYADQMACDCDECKRFSKHFELSRRERELWQEMIKMRMVSGMFPMDAVHLSDTDLNLDMSGLVTRGFLSRVTCSWNSWREHADAILRTQPVERVRLTTWPNYFFGAEGGSWHNSSSDWFECRHFRTAAARRWPGITFELPAERTSQRVPPPIFPPPIRR